MQQRQHHPGGMIVDDAGYDLHVGILQLQKLRIIVDGVRNDPFKKIEPSLKSIDP